MAWITRIWTMAALLLADSAVLPPPHLENIAIIVNASRAAELDVDEIAQIYLKKRRFWRDGTPILPVNRNSDAETREHFDHMVFGGSERRLTEYWNRAYFSGVLPPATLASDEAVRRFIESEPRAIGYVRAITVDDSVRVVLILDAEAP
jgi:ABC-type phosphate transport system substrate-binding protein